MSVKLVLEDKFVFETENAKFYVNQNTEILTRDLQQMHEHFRCYKAMMPDGAHYVIVDHEIGQVIFEGTSDWQSVFNMLNYIKFERSANE